VVFVSGTLAIGLGRRFVLVAHTHLMGGRQRNNSGFYSPMKPWGCLKVRLMWCTFSLAKAPPSAGNGWSGASGRFRTGVRTNEAGGSFCSDGPGAGRYWRTGVK